MMRSLLKYSLLPGLLAAGLTGCVADGSVGVRATVVAPPPPQVYVNADVGVNADAGAQVQEVAYVEPTSYVYVSPGVQVIEGYPDPVFLSGGFYWRQEGGVWYSSTWHDRGWAYQASPPDYVVHISNPSVYVNYHGNVNARVGEVGYVGVAASHPVHVGQPPRYVERPPAVRGGQPVRYNPPANHNAGPAYGGNRPVEQGHGPVENRPTTYNATEHPEPGRPVEQGHGPAENHPTNYNASEHPEGGNKPAEPTHGYTPAANNKPAAAPPKAQPKPAPKKEEKK